MRRVVTTFIAGLLALCLLTITASARNPKIAADLNNLPFQATARLIVKYRAPVAEAEAHRAKRAPIRSLRIMARLDLLNAEAVSILGSDLALLADDPNVEYVWPDRQVHGSAYSGTPDYGWIAVGAQAASDQFGLDGRGIGVAVLDSGFCGYQAHLGHAREHAKVVRPHRTEPDDTRSG